MNIVGIDNIMRCYVSLKNIHVISNLRTSQHFTIIGFCFQALNHSIVFRFEILEDAADLISRVVHLMSIYMAFLFC